MNGLNEALPNSNYHFIAMEYYSLVHGIISSESSDKSHPTHIFTVKGNLYDPTVYLDQKYLNKLNGIDFQSEAFLSLNKMGWK